MALGDIFYDTENVIWARVGMNGSTVWADFEQLFRTLGHREGHPVTRTLRTRCRQSAPQGIASPTLPGGALGVQAWVHRMQAGFPAPCREFGHTCDYCGKKFKASG